MAVDIQHRTGDRGGRFYVEGADKDIGYLDYKVDKDVLTIVLTIEHTVVEDELKGTGAARQLVDEAVKFATGKNYRIESTCDYATHVLGKYYAER